MNYQRLAIGFLSLATVSVGAGSAQAASLSNYYGLNNSLAGQFGGPSLVTVGGTLTSTGGYTFGANQGLRLTGALANPDNYSILLDYSLNNTTTPTFNNFKKVIDFKGLSSDNGLYQANEKLTFNPGPATTGSTVVPDGTAARLVLTRTGATTAAYFNGVQQFSFLDSGNNASFGLANVINFFQDDVNQRFGVEASSGFVRDIAIYDGALTSTQVASLGGVGTAIPGTEVPEPFTIIGTLVGGSAALRMRKKLKADQA